MGSARSDRRGTEASEKAPRDAAATRWRLLDVALTLFSEQGYAATSVRQILKAAGVTQPALYYHFQNKEDLFRELVTHHYEASFADLKQAIAQETGCEEKLRAIIRCSFSGSAADPRVPRLMFQTYFGPPVKELGQLLEHLSDIRFLIVYEVVAAGLEAGELRGGQAGAVTLAFCCLMDQHINVLCRRSNPQARLTLELADSLVDTFLYGLGMRRRASPNLPPLPEIDQASDAKG